MSNASNYTLGELKRIAGVDPAITAFSYLADFEDLWAHVDAGFPSAVRDVFVIWDGVPLADGRLETPARNFLTIFDWAAAVAVVTSGVGRSAPAVVDSFDFRLHVLVAHTNDLPNSLSLRTFPLLQRTIAPWVKLYSSYDGPAFLHAAESVIRDVDHVTILEFLTTPGGQARRSSEFIRDLWVANLTGAETRHSVSNTIGPVTLAQCLKADGFRAADAVLDNWIGKTHPLNSAFWQLLEIFDLVPPFRKQAFVTRPQSALGGLTEDDIVAENLFGQFDRVRFVLLDDQANSGFHDALCAFLLGPNPIRVDASATRAEMYAHSTSNNNRYSLTSYTQPEFLLRWFAQSEPSAPYTARPFGRCKDTPQDEFDVLFLDLRLHGINGTRAERESARIWTTRLLEVAKHQLIPRVTELAASPEQVDALRTAVNAAERYVSRSTEQDSSLAQLALLPIAISLYDPTLPIVLFTSTRQKAVLELLAPFPNIDTRFSKPAITGYSLEDKASITRCVANLVQVLRRSLEIHEKRVVWTLIANFSLDVARPPPCVISRPVGGELPMATFDSREWFLVNAAKPPELPILSNRVFQRKFRDLYRDFILGADALDSLFKPYEFIESCLTAEYQRQTDTEDGLDFRFSAKAFGQFARSGGIPGTRQRALPIHWTKQARHAYAHGKFSSSEESPLLARYLSLIALVQLSRAIGTDKVVKRVEALLEKTNSLLVAQIQRPHEVELMTEWDLTAIWANSRPLARAVTAMADKIWPWDPMSNVFNSGL